VGGQQGRDDKRDCDAGNESTQNKAIVQGLSWLCPPLIITTYAATGANYPIMRIQTGCNLRVTGFHAAVKSLRLPLTPM